ncbi:MAG: hypothetical protein MJZ78_06775 [Bacteroidales bacterium]|nr:hypothetical protein [Bacteroidales bacterium]
MLLPCVAAMVVFMTSCKTPHEVYHVAYQSVRTTFRQPDESHPIPDEAEIILTYSLSADGVLTVLVKNNTDEIMMIDQTNSFFVNSDGSSTSYYDPTVYTTTVSDINSSTRGVSVNAGAVANALGAGSGLTSLLSGVNVGGSNTGGQITSNVTQVADLPVVSVAPKGTVVMSKKFNVHRIDKSRADFVYVTNVDMTPTNSTCRFSVCISYSTDGGENYDKLKTDMYVNSEVFAMVQDDSKINDAVSEIYKTKTDAIYEPLWFMYIGRMPTFNGRITTYNGRDFISNEGVLFDFQ